MTAAAAHLRRVGGALGEAGHEPREDAAHLYVRLELWADAEDGLQRVQVELVWKHLNGEEVGD